MRPFRQRRDARWLLLAAALLPTVATPQAPAPADPGPRIVAAARRQVGVTVRYDPSYARLAYPGGDVPLETGVCSDVVVRALRDVGLDLQRAVHEDMRAHFAAYPANWGLKKPDPNIDHRRVPNLARYFERHHVVADGSAGRPEAFRPGDIVAWDLGRGVKHIGIVSDRKAGAVPLVIHNIGRGAQEEDILFRYRILGHYRVRPPAP